MKKRSIVTSSPAAGGATVWTWRHATRVAGSAPMSSPAASCSDSHPMKPWTSAPRRYTVNEPGWRANQCAAHPADASPSWRATIATMGHVGKVVDEPRQQRVDDLGRVQAVDQCVCTGLVEDVNGDRQ